MSSPKHRIVFVIAVLAALTGLAGCQIRPLYSTGGGEVGPQADLPAIDVQESGTRTEQVFRNALLFALRGGGEGAEARYKLIYRLTIREQQVLVERGTGTPNIYQLTGGVSFLLKDATTDNSIFGASVTTTNSYTRSSQSYSNLRAKRDAEDRISKALAALTQVRLAAYFATH